MRSTSVIVLLLGLTLSGAADAQMFAGPCHVNALCPGVARGGGRIMNCLRAHRAGLSQQCLAAIGRMVLDRASRGRNRMGSMPGPGGPYGGGPNGGGPYGGPNGGAPYGGAGPNGGAPYGGAPNGGGQNDGGPNDGSPNEDGGN